MLVLDGTSRVKDLPDSTELDGASSSEKFMMDATDLTPLLDVLDDNIDDLEEAVEPLIKGALSDIVGRLPLLDKAKLYVLVTYAVESMLFCWYLSLESIHESL